MTNSIFFLSGLPRTGATLFTSILDQNPNTHTEGNSSLCQFMWDVQCSSRNIEQVYNKPNFPGKFLSKIPEIFYEGVDKNIIDKCRSWSIPENIDMINNYITKDFKMIIMIRPIIEIVKSFVYIRNQNGWEDSEFGLLDEDSDPIMRSLNGVRYANSINNGQFLFISYDELIEDTAKTIDRVYDFFGWERFDHYLSNIVNNNPEPDFLINMSGLHTIRDTIGRREIDVSLSKELYEKAISTSIF